MFQAKRLALLKRNEERESKLHELRSRRSASGVFGFGSSVPRSMLVPGVGEVLLDGTKRAVSQGSLLRHGPGAGVVSPELTPGLPGDAASARGVTGRRAVSASSLARRPHRAAAAASTNLSQHDKHGMLLLCFSVS